MNFRDKSVITFKVNEAYERFFFHRHRWTTKETAQANE